MNKNIFLTLLASVGFVNLGASYGTASDEARDAADDPYSLFDDDDFSVRYYKNKIIKKNNGETIEYNLNEVTEDETLPVVYKIRFTEDNLKSRDFKEKVYDLLNQGKESEARFEIANWIIKWRPGVVIPSANFDEGTLQKIEDLFKENDVDIRLLLSGIEGFTQHKEIENDLYGIMLEELNQCIKKLNGISNEEYNLQITFPDAGRQEDLFFNKESYMINSFFTKEFIRQCFNNRQSLLLLDIVPENLIDFLSSQTKRSKAELEMMCQEIICGRTEIPEEWKLIPREMFNETLKTLKTKLGECLNEQRQLNKKEEQERIEKALRKDKYLVLGIQKNIENMLAQKEKEFLTRIDMLQNEINEQWQHIGRLEAQLQESAGRSDQRLGDASPSQGGE